MKKGNEVNKNTVLAIFLILIVVTLFSTESYNKFFYENIYPRKQYVSRTYETTVVKEIKKEEETKNAEDTKRYIDTNKVEKIYDTLNESVVTIQNDTVIIETDKMIVAIQEKGATIISAKMKEYKYFDEKNEERKKNSIVDIIPLNNGNGASLSIKGENLDTKHFEYTGNEKTIKVNDEKEIELSFSYNENGNEIKKNFIFKNNTYKVKLEVLKNNLIGQNIEIGWKCGIEESEISKAMQPEIRTAHYSDGKQSQHFQMNKEDNETASGEYKWVGITSKYFFAAIVNDKGTNADLSIQSFKQNDEVINKKDNAINYRISYATVAEENIERFWIYIGPNDYKELKKYNLSFDNNLFPVLSWAKHLFFSDKWFPAIAEAVLWLLIKLHAIVKDYGVTIILLRLLVKLVTYPMTYSSMKSMSRMRDIQPKIQHLRDKHKNNPKKMNEEMMALYKKEGINPLNPGCLPMFLQMPIFIALFVVLRKAIELRGAETVILPWVHDLSKPEMIFQLPWNIPLYGNNFAILPIIMAILTYFQNKMTIKDPNQKAMIYFMPIFMLVLFNSFSSGLVLYWTLSNAFAIVQQIITDKQIKKITTTK